MSHYRDLIDDLAVHALGANDGADRAALEDAVRTDPSLRDSITGFDRVVDVMLDSFEDSTPPPSVWASIEQSIAQPAPSRNVPWAWLTTIAAAVSLVATFSLVVTSQATDPTVSELAAELQADPAETQRLLKLGADKAQEIAAATLARARDNIGLLAGG